MAGTGEQVGRRRLRSHRLVGTGFTDPVDVVRWMGALQAQDYGQSLWAIGARLRTPSLAAVEAAIADRTIVRTWPMRGTIHWVPAADAAWMVALSAARTVGAHATRMRQLELDDATVTQAGKLLDAELAGGGSLTRPEVMALWQAAGISTDGQRGYTLLWSLAHTGSIVIGPMQGRQQTFVALDDVAPAATRATPADPGAELARRYLQSHGPATVRDFAWWSGCTLGDARRRVGDVEPGRVGEREFLAAGVPARAVPGVRLLAGFDEFLLGYQQRSDVLAAEHFEQVVPGNNGIFQPCIVADGQLVGTWKRLVRKGSVEIVGLPFVAGTLSADTLTPAAERYASFLGLPLGAVSVGS